MATTNEEYLKARKLATKEYQKVLSEGRYPYLPALEHMLPNWNTLPEEPVGTIEIPISFIIGTVTTGRQDAFARNFMPLLAPDTEFGNKWISLYDYQTSQGINEAIKVIEFMGKFYVLEGNKRVSVLKFLEQPTILATVTRALPPKTEEPENLIYYEFLKFFKCTSIYDITFTQEGGYEKLSEAVGKTLDEVWDEDTILDLKSAFLNFTKAYMTGGGKAFQITPGDALLVYIGLYKYESLINTPADEIKKNLSQIWKEIRIRANGNQITFSEEPQLEKKDAIPIISNLIKKQYTEKNPLKVLFLYDRRPEKSRWVNGHEQGRLELEKAFPDIVKTLMCICENSEEEFDDAIDAAVADGADLIITISPAQMEYALRASVKYPQTKFLNCSIYLSQAGVRPYYGRMHEAKLLLGVIAAALSPDHRIGYVANYPISGAVANINAFAIGASMVDPQAKIYLTWSCLKDRSWRDFIRENNLRIVSGPDLIRPVNADNEYGLYSLDDDGEITNIAFPLWNWGHYYELIVQKILNDAWDSEEAGIDKDTAVNYWWGMASGVIDIKKCEAIPYGINKMVNALKYSITADLFSPFDGELRSQTGIIKPEESPRLTNEEILGMDWLNENVIGSIPSMDEIVESAHNTIKSNGVMSVIKGETSAT